LSDVKIEDMTTLEKAIQVMHERYQVPHIIITSVALDHPDHPQCSLSVVGSTMTSDRRARAFKIVFPAIDAYFSGTGDMFAALMVVRMREAAHGTPGLGARRSWTSDDGVAALDLPLARAAEKVLASMHEVLSKTCESMNAELARVTEADPKRLHLIKSRAAELRLVRDLGSLRSPAVEFRAQLM
jgi:pyridoxine kinase